MNSGAFSRFPCAMEAKNRHAPLDATIGRAKGAVAETAASGIGRTPSTEMMVSDRIERPWALMRHHAGWADVFHIDSETSDSITGFYPDRESVGPPVTYSLRAVLARYLTIESARAAREGAVSEWRKHDAGVRDAETALHAAEKLREDAWLNSLRDAASRG